MSTERVPLYEVDGAHTANTFNEILRRRKESGWRIMAGSFSAQAPEPGKRYCALFVLEAPPLPNAEVPQNPKEKAEADTHNQKEYLLVRNLGPARLRHYAAGGNESAQRELERREKETAEGGGPALIGEFPAADAQPQAEETDMGMKTPTELWALRREGNEHATREWNRRQKILDDRQDRMRGKIQAEADAAHTPEEPTE